MRIVIIADCYLPSIKSCATLVHDLGKGLLNSGHEVTILTLRDSIPEPLRVSTENGLCVAQVKTGNIKRANKVLRAFREIRLSATLWRRARTFLLGNPADLIVFYSPSIFLGPLVRRLKSIWNCPSYLILRDIFPQWAVDAGILRKGLVWKYFRKKEIEQYDAADLIGVESQANLEYFRENFPEGRYRLQVLYNWTSLERRSLPPVEYRDRLGLKDKVIFFYGGNLGIAQDLHNFVRLAARLSPYPQIHFLLVGEGSEASKLKASISENHLLNIQVLPSVPELEYLAMLSDADVGLISLDRRLKTHNLPGKLLGYMHLSKPILASINPGNDLFELLPQSHAGFCLANGDDNKLMTAALKLAADPELRAFMGQQSRNLLERLFSVQKAVDQIVGPFHNQTRYARQSAAASKSIGARSLGSAEIDPLG